MLTGKVPMFSIFRNVGDLPVDTAYNNIETLKSLARLSGEPQIS
jgi:hypothetical protein